MIGRANFYGLPFNMVTLPENQLLRLLHVSPSFYPAIEYGGPVASLYELCLVQQRAGLLVRVLTSTAGCDTTLTTPTGLGILERWERWERWGPWGRWVERFGVPTYYARVHLPPDLAPAMVPQLVRWCHWAQVVHITGIFSAASVMALATTLATNLGSGLARRLGRGLRSGRDFGRERVVVLSPRGALLPWALAQEGGRARKQRFLTALAPLLRRVHGWHVTSEDEAWAVQEVLKTLGAPRPNIQVVAPGVGSEGAAGGGHAAERGLSSQLLVLGRIHRVKNLELALDALALLRRDLPEASLVIAGPVADGAYAAELAARAAALGLGPAVKWVGLVTGAAKQQLLVESAALWLCSHMESFGNVVIEALAAGTPVIATRTTPWELLEQGAVGRWIAPNPQALAAATRELLAGQLEARPRQQLAARCRQLAQARFSWTQAERQLRQLYYDVLA